MSDPGWLDAEGRRMGEIEACRLAIERGLVDIDLPLDHGGSVALAGTGDSTEDDSDSRAVIRDALTSGFGVLCTMGE